jgi:hypothetical protein
MDCVLKPPFKSHRSFEWLAEIFISFSAPSTRLLPYQTFVEATFNKQTSPTTQAASNIAGRRHLIQSHDHAKHATMCMS